MKILSELIFIAHTLKFIDYFMIFLSSFVFIFNQALSTRAFGRRANDSDNTGRIRRKELKDQSGAVQSLFFIIHTIKANFYNECKTYVFSKISSAYKDQNAPDRKTLHKIFLYESMTLSPLKFTHM